MIANAREWLEVGMAMSRKDPRGSRVYAVPLFGIAVLLASYWVLVDWQELPSMLDSALSLMHL